MLEAAGLVVSEKQGRRHLYRLNTPPLAEASTWFDFYRAFWTDQLDALERHIHIKERSTHD